MAGITNLYKEHGEVSPASDSSFALVDKEHCFFDWWTQHNGMAWSKAAEKMICLKQPQLLRGSTESRQEQLKICCFWQFGSHHVFRNH